MAGKLIKLENEYYLTTEVKVEKGDYGLAFAHGVRNGFGRGWYIFYHDGRPVNKLNAICAGTRKITHSTAPIVGSSFHIIEQLSLKNCEAIERGYDLDELADECQNILIKDNWRESPSQKIAFTLGFQKALEILGDKKFSEDDMIQYAWYVVKTMGEYASHEGANSSLAMLKVWQSLQQNEWDVEIVTEPYVKYVNSSVYPPLGIQNKLDAEGNLILKRK